MFEFLAALALACSLAAAGDPPVPGGGAAGDPPVPGGGDRSIQTTEGPIIPPPSTYGDPPTPGNQGDPPPPG